MSEPHEPDAPELEGEDVPPTDPAPPARPALASAVDAPRAGSRRMVQRPEAPRLDPERPHIIDESKRR